MCFSRQTSRVMWYCMCGTRDDHDASFEAHPGELKRKGTCQSFVHRWLNQASSWAGLDDIGISRRILPQPSLAVTIRARSYQTYVHSSHLFNDVKHQGYVASNCPAAQPTPSTITGQRTPFSRATARDRLLRLKKMICSLHNEWSSWDAAPLQKE